MSTKFNYQRYLASREWGLLKRQVRERSGGNCERGHLEAVAATAVHHTTYERIGHEDLADLLHVCEACHEFLGGHSDRDPVGNSKYRPRIAVLYGLVDWFARDFELPIQGNFEQYVRDHALSYGDDPDEALRLATEILEESESWFRIRWDRGWRPEGYEERKKERDERWAGQS